jgi:hypothetical protein
MKGFALVTQHHRIVTSKLLPVVPYAEKRIPGSIIFRGCKYGISIPLSDILMGTCGIINRGLQRTLTIKNVYRNLVSVRINDNADTTPFQVEVWSADDQKWVPWLEHEPVQMYMLRAPQATT